MALKTNVARGIVALGVVGALASTAHAERRTGLGGSLLIEDNDDVFLFPNKTSAYKNQLWLDYGATAGAGNAVLTLGDQDFAYGIGLHRGDVKGPFLTNSLVPDTDSRSLGILDRDRLGGPGDAGPANAPFSAFNPAFTIDSATFVDLFASFGDIGVRAVIGRAVNSTTDPVTEDDTGEHETFLSAQVGWGTGTRGVDTRLDIAGALTVDFGGVVNAGTDVASGTAIGVGGLLRGYSPVDSTMDLGYLASLNIQSVSVTNEAVANDPSSSALGFNLGGGVGPAFTFGQTQLAAYATMRLGYESVEPNSEVNDDEVSTLRVMLPGVQLATEIALTDWLRIRTGAEYSWQLEDESGPGDGGAGVQDGVFAWNAGFGIYVDDFRFDGALQHGFVTGGPDFIGGSPNGPGFLAVASLTYNFDAARSGATPAPEAQEPAPAPVEPAPALEPAPAPAEPAPAPADPAGANPEAGATGTVGGGVGGSLSIGQ